MLTKFFEKDFYKEAAFKKMDAIKRNDEACFAMRGRRMGSAVKARMLENVAFLRRRYTGKEALPEIHYLELD